MTNPRVFVEALPCRLFARNAFTAWCITGMFTVPSNRSAGSSTFSRAVPLAEYAAAFIVVVSAISLTLLLHEHDAVGRTGHRTADVNQISLGIDALDAKVRLCV